MRIVSTFDVCLYPRIGATKAHTGDRGTLRMQGHHGDMTVLDDLAASLGLSTRIMNIDFPLSIP